jgi:UDPglucose 6-dehydrogenase
MPPVDVDSHEPIGVLGLWHLGSVTAACLAEAGNEVLGVDPDVYVVKELSEGRPLVSEPGLSELIAHNAARLRFSAEPLALAEAGRAWVAFDTPIDDGDRADVDWVLAHSAQLLAPLPADALVVVSSQLPVGSVAQLQARCASLRGEDSLRFACVPENLRLGGALDCFRAPERIVAGVRSGRDRRELFELLAPFSSNVQWMRVESAEMTKHALNGFLATSVAFMNEVAAICESVGADAAEVSHGLKSERRIGPHAYLDPGEAFAGGTLARDVGFLRGLAEHHGLPAHVSTGVAHGNAAHKRWTRRKLLELLGKGALSERPLAGRVVAIWGLTYKPGTDTLRRSGAVELCHWLAGAGAHVRAHDPAVSALPPDLVGKIELCPGPLDAVAGAEILVVCTPWPDYLDVPIDEVLSVLAHAVVVDPAGLLGSSVTSHPEVRYVRVGSPASDAGLVEPSPHAGLAEPSPHAGGHASLSVVIPAFNEENNVERIYARLGKVLCTLDLDWELVFSVDPCTDRTEELILALRARDPRVKMLRFSRRFGQPMATLAGMEAAAGDAVVVIDCDLQDPPEVIADLVGRWREGYDVVYAQRRTRAGETLPKRIVSALGYRVIARIAEVEIPPDTGDFRLMSRRVVENVLALKETHGFLRGLVGLVGFRQTSVLYDREPRAAGSSKYNRFVGSLWIGLNGLIGFSRYPLQLISIIGVTLSCFAFLLAVVYATLKLLGVSFPGGIPTVVIVIAFFAGIQLLSLGVIGEYVGRIYNESRLRPKYIIESRYGWDE